MSDDDILAWLNAPDDAPAPSSDGAPAATKSEILSALVSQMGSSSLVAKETNVAASTRVTQLDSDDDEEEQRDTTVADKNESISKNAAAAMMAVKKEILPVAKELSPPAASPPTRAIDSSPSILRLQLEEMERRLNLEREGTCSVLECYRKLLTKSLAYTREREQQLIFDNNKRLISSDLIKELAAANRATSDELGSVLSMMMMRAQQNQQRAPPPAQIAPSGRKKK